MSRSLTNENINTSALNWIIYGSSKDDIIKIQKEVDKIFFDYSFYPEIEWAQYGYRAPEGHQVLGAWRHTDGDVFIFLLDNPNMFIMEPNVQLLLLIVGKASEVYKLEKRCDHLKTKFAIKEEKEEKDLEIKYRLENIRKSKSVGFISSILGIFTVVINGFSLYLRKLPTPEFGNQFLKTVYEVLIALVHFSSLILLFIVILILALFLIKYGIMLIKKL